MLALPPGTKIHPGHKEPSTIGEEWEHNPFVRVWRGLDPEGAEPCTVGGEPATLLLWGPDYDGTHKALVEYADGRRAIVEAPDPKAEAEAIVAEIAAATGSKGGM